MIAHAGAATGRVRATFHRNDVPGTGISAYCIVSRMVDWRSRDCCEGRVCNGVPVSQLRRFEKRDHSRTCGIVAGNIVSQPWIALFSLYQSWQASDELRHMRSNPYTFSE